MKSKKRAMCGVCERSQKLRKTDGKIMKHLDCAGGSWPPGWKQGTVSNYLPSACKGQTVKVTKTRVAVVVDNSYSMAGIKTRAEEAVREIFKSLNEQDNSYTIDVWTFDQDVRQKSFALKPGQLGGFEILPTGWTAMYDAIGKATKGLGDNEDTAYLVVVITDGEENRSRVFTAASLRKLIMEKQKTGRWTFAFSVPRGYRYGIVRDLKVPKGNVTEWDQTDEGTIAMGLANSTALDSYSNARRSGQTRVETFYLDVNVGRLDPDVFTRGMSPVKGRFRSIKASRRMEIHEAVEAKKLKYVAGCAYYALIKPERVAPHKGIVLRRKDTGDIFAGAEVRKILGLPDNQDANLTPKNLGEWDVFIQSDSNNRLLLSKMEILYDKQAK